MIRDKKKQQNRKVAALVAIATVMFQFCLLITATELVSYRLPSWWRMEYDRHNVVQHVRGGLPL